jgi:UrcA family protein
MSVKIMLNAVSVAAAISIGALGLGGLAAPALADDAHISVGDLNLDTPQGRARFDERVKAAAKEMCASYQQLSRHRQCLSDFREAADENLLEQQARLVRQQGAGMTVVRR